MPVCLSEPMGSALGARAYFLFDGKKKVAKEKATPGSAPGCARSLALLGRPGGWLNSPSAQTTPADCPRPACVAQRLSGGPGKSSQHDHTATPTACCGRRPRKGRNQDQQNSSSARAVFPGPLGGAEQRRNAGGSRRALFEGRSPELRSRPAFRVAQGIPAGDTDPGVAFSLATFFWPHKRKYARASGAETDISENKNKHRARSLLADIHHNNTPNTKRPGCPGRFSYPRRIASKNSALPLVDLTLSSRNSIAARSSMG